MVKVVFKIEGLSYFAEVPNNIKIKGKVKPIRPGENLSQYSVERKSERVKDRGRGGSSY